MIIPVCYYTYLFSPSLYPFVFTLTWSCVWVDLKRNYYYCKFWMHLLWFDLLYIYRQTSLSDCLAVCIYAILSVFTPSYISAGVCMSACLSFHISKCYYLFIISRHSRSYPARKVLLSDYPLLFIDVPTSTGPQHLQEKMTERPRKTNHAR